MQTVADRHQSYEDRQHSYEDRQHSYEDRQHSYEDRQHSYEDRQHNYADNTPTDRTPMLQATQLYEQTAQLCRQLQTGSTAMQTIADRQHSFG